MLELVDAALASVAEAVHPPLTPASRDALLSYVALVFRWQRIANLTGAPDPATFVRQHVSDSLSVLPHVGAGPLADIGSGAGLPGLVLAIAQPALEVVLVEPRGKRARFLEQARIELGLSNVSVEAGRVQDWHPLHPPQTLICRAFASIADFLNATLHLQSPGVRMLAMKGDLPEVELAALDPGRYRSEVLPLEVAGWARRHLVALDCR